MKGARLTNYKNITNYYLMKFSASNRIKVNLNLITTIRLILLMNVTLIWLNEKLTLKIKKPFSQSNLNLSHHERVV